MKLGTQEINPNSRGSITTFLFAGAKEVATIKSYEKNLEIYNFIDSVDWGWFFFLTKPIFSLLEIFNSYIGNMGWSIILLTLLFQGPGFLVEVSFVASCTVLPSGNP